jgi:hypothetical protein
VVVLVVWCAVAGFCLVLLAILGYGLFSQVKRLLRTVEAARDQMLPLARSVQPQTPQGRHRAD